MLPQCVHLRKPVEIRYAVFVKAQMRLCIPLTPFPLYGQKKLYRASQNFVGALLISQPSTNSLKCHPSVPLSPVYVKPEKSSSRPLFSCVLLACTTLSTTGSLKNSSSKLLCNGWKASERTKVQQYVYMVHRVLIFLCPPSGHVPCIHFTLHVRFKCDRDLLVVQGGPVHSIEKWCGLNIFYIL